MQQHVRLWPGLKRQPDYRAHLRVSQSEPNVCADLTLCFGQLTILPRPSACVHVYVYIDSQTRGSLHVHIACPRLPEAMTGPFMQRSVRAMLQAWVDLGNQAERGVVWPAFTAQNCHDAKQKTQSGNKRPPADDDEDAPSPSAGKPSSVAARGPAKRARPN